MDITVIYAENRLKRTKYGSYTAHRDTSIIFNLDEVTRVTSTSHNRFQLIIELDRPIDHSNETKQEITFYIYVRHKPPPRKSLLWANNKHENYFKVHIFQSIIRYSLSIIHPSICFLCRSHSCRHFKRIDCDRV